MNSRIRETARYLGYGKNAVDEQTLELIAASFYELAKVIRERFIYRVFDVKIKDAQFISVAGMMLDSRNLAKNLDGCNKVVLFGATLGIEVDLLIRKYTVSDMAKAVVMQACAAVRMEELCDRVEETCSQEFCDAKMRPRFSPGYGDLSIMHQDEILRVLDAARKIGLTRTEGYMLTPTKSVTAFIGVIVREPKKE